VSVNTGPRFRRSPHVVCYWHRGRFIVHEYLAGRRVAAPPAVVDVLDYCATWRSGKAILTHLDAYAPDAVTRVVDDLVEHSLLRRSGRPDGRSLRVDRGLSKWESWNPAAGFFHFSTKDVRYPPDLETAARRLRRRTRGVPMPSSVKRYPLASRIPLPPNGLQDEFTTVLLQRRTWRSFSSRHVSLADLGALLQLTWGVQQWASVPGQGRVALKTSPSGGARHPGEVYVLALRIEGLRRGLYHYAPDRHELEVLGSGSSARQVDRYLPGQAWYRGAAALLLMTVVFPREQWRYRFPRAYRAVLLEAGHLCQTCCLVATWLGLAPFCSMAFSDTRIERDLGINGIDEAVLYVAGVGARPARRAHPSTP
jgi:SagB-type dehydrogenase family enzyme